MVRSVGERPRRCVQSKLRFLLAAEETASPPVVEEGGDREVKSKPKRKPPTPKKSPVTRKEARGLSAKGKNFISVENLDCQNMYIDHPVLLEAKIAAEEKVKLSATTQVHPFFTFWNGGKRSQEAQGITKVGIRWSSPDSCSPIHVFDNNLEDVVSVDWRNWEFTEKTPLFLNDYHSPENTSVFEGSVEPLELDTDFCGRMHMDQLHDRGSKSYSISTTSALLNGKHTHEHLPAQSEVYVSSNISLSSSCASFVCDLESDQQDKLLKERLSSYYRRCSRSPDCSLWTDKYQPENALEVCGNRESIKFLSEWLKSWHERGADSSKGSKGDDLYVIEDSEDSLYEIESDMDEKDDDATLQNVLLITGPIGSGKSAAIYACAKEQGFEIIEVNASDLRNGSHVKKKYGEAMESHGFNKWSNKDPVGPKRKNIHELLSNSFEVRDGKLFECSLLETSSSACNHNITPSKESKQSSNDMENRTPSHQVANKTLILFEDVDIVFEEDRGFVSSILQLAETAKRPIILTSNDKNLVLPRALDRLVLDFTVLPSVELLPHLYRICASEKAYVPSNLLEHLIKSCLGDIRKTLILLQFWCQGKSGIDGSMKCTYSPLPCDIDAAHLVMPRILPWGFHCELSIKVEEEISKTIYEVEQNLWSMKQQELLSSSDMGNNMTDAIKGRKKKRRLKRNQSFIDDRAEISDNNNNLDDFSSPLRSPVIYSRRRVKHRPGTVLSSPSEGQSDIDNNPTVDTIPDVSPVLQTNLELPVEPIYHSIGDDTVRTPVECSEMVSASHICDTFKLQDVSCVPESSFISTTETQKNEFMSMSESPNNRSVTFADFNKSIHVPDRMIIEPNKCLEKIDCESYEVDVESVHGNEELEDSQNVSKESPRIVYHLMDECSQADFSKRSSKGNEDPVQDAWRKLHSRREDLNPCFTTNQTDASLALKLASGLTNLISETDILFSTCNSLFNEILEPSRTPNVEPDIFSSYEKQLEMGSTYAQHGLCFYSHKCVIVGTNLGSENTLNLAEEMLAHSNSTMALGKLLTRGNTPRRDSNVEGGDHVKAPRSSLSMTRRSKGDLYDAVSLIVPKRSSMTLRGPAFHDYLSFMSQISKIEPSLLSESSMKNKRRSRSSRDYLGSGSLPLSPENVELLARSCCFNKEASPRSKKQLFP